MDTKEFISATRPSTTRHKVRRNMFNFFVKDLLSLRGFLALGALCQIALFSFLPYRIALIPAVLSGLYSLLSTIIQATSSKADSFMDNVIMGRTSAQLPFRKTGRYGYEPSAQPIVVVHLGVRFNHPLGLLAPGVKETGDHFTACNKALREDSEEYGLLGMSTWREDERSTNNTILNVYYFRDVEGLRRFSHSEVHRMAWSWFEKKAYKHIGVFHEAFCAPAKAYESVYINCPPLMLGATSVKCTNEGGQENWIQPVVKANVPPLKSQFSSMERAFREIKNYA